MPLRNVLVTMLIKTLSRNTARESFSKNRIPRVSYVVTDSEILERVARQEVYEWAKKKSPGCHMPFPETTN